MISMPEQQFEDLIESAAERGARKALASVGLSDDRAVDDVREMRSLMWAYRTIKKSALQQLGKTIMLLIIGAILMYIGVRLKWGFGP